MLLPGDGASEAGTMDDPGSNRKTMLELLSLDPHENNVLPSYRLIIFVPIVAWWRSLTSVMF